MRFFKMANQIFDYPLTPNGFQVYSYLLSRINLLQTVIIGYQAIADACHIDPKTACRAIDELTSLNLITKEHRYNVLGYSKNKYVVKKPHGGWFKVEYSILRAGIKSTDFMVYCYLKKCMDAKQEEAFPSLNTISKSTGISRSRVVLAVRYLREHTYINRVKRHYKKTKAYRQNRYLKFKFKKLEQANKKKETRPLKRTSFKAFLAKKSQPLIYMIERMVTNVKSFFFSRGSSKIP